MQKIIVVIAVLAVVAVLSGGGYYYYQQTVLLPRQEAQVRTDAYQASLLRDEPATLQDILVQDIGNGKNNAYTKSDAYFVTHRFFDNGGNIYEIYDFVNANPELAFMKEAESIYPDTFKQIQERTIPTVFSNAGFYAYLAYLEVLDKHGYAGVAALSTAANQYAKLGYFSILGKREKASGEPDPGNYQYVIFDAKMAVRFADEAGPDIVRILDGVTASGEILERDVVVGLNQYASATRYLEALGAPFSPVRPADQVFSFVVNYSYRYVPELHLFTSLTNASTLLLFASSTPTQIRQALFPLIDYIAQNKEPVGILAKLVAAKNEPKAETIEDVNFDVYGKRNMVLLAGAVPEFKAWLIQNGWVEADFTSK